MSWGSLDTVSASSSELSSNLSLRVSRLMMRERIVVPAEGFFCQRQNNVASRQTLGRQSLKTPWWFELLIVDVILHHRFWSQSFHGQIVSHLRSFLEGETTQNVLSLAKCSCLGLQRCLYLLRKQYVLKFQVTEFSKHLRMWILIEPHFLIKRGCKGWDITQITAQMFN